MSLDNSGGCISDGDDGGVGATFAENFGGAVLLPAVVLSLDALSELESGSSNVSF